MNHSRGTDWKITSLHVKRDQGKLYPHEHMCIFKSYEENQAWELTNTLDQGRIQTKCNTPIKKRTPNIAMGIAPINLSSDHPVCAPGTTRQTLDCHLLDHRLGFSLAQLTIEMAYSNCRLLSSVCLSIEIIKITSHNLCVWCYGWQINL